MSSRMPNFRILRPAFCSGLLDDPILLVQNSVTGKNLLFDCGQLHHLAKRELMALEAVFISHGHMDHLMGVDLLFRHLHALPRTLSFFGPPGIADRIDHKLRGYNWNLAEAFWATFEVHEISESVHSLTRFVGPEGFQRTPAIDMAPNTDVIYRNAHLQVRARLCEHRIPSLIFRVEEVPFFLIDAKKLEAQGFQPGPWLGELKHRLADSDDAPSPLHVPHFERGIEERTDLVTLYQQIKKDDDPGGLGYISDIGWTAKNRETIQTLMSGIKLLVCECTFRAEDEARARSSAHLCTTDVRWLAEQLRPEALLPMHMSKRYRDHGQKLYEELVFPAETRLLQIPQFVTPAPLRMNDFS